MSIPEYTINGYGEKHIIEKNHFVIQTVRLPTNEEPSLRKIMQVALNIAQYQASREPKIKLKYNKIEDFILKNDSQTKLSDILSENDLHEIQKLLRK